MERDFVLRKRNQSGARDERGAAAVEFGLVALILTRDVEPTAGRRETVPAKDFLS